MTLMRRTSPFGEFLSLRQAMDRLFEDSVVQPRSLMGSGGEEHGIPLDIASTPEELRIEASLPGVRPEDVEITVLGDNLVINATSGGEDTREDDGYLYREVRRGRFSRSVTLPSQVDSERAVASFENGLLRLSIPKVEAAKPRQIRVSTTSESTATQVGEGDRNGTDAAATSDDA